MAENILEISGLCPIKFKDVDYVNPAPYNTNYFEDHHYRDTLPYYASADDYFHPWQKNDIIYLQFRANYGPHNIELVNQWGIKVNDLVATYVATSTEASGLKVYQASLALNTYAEGIYKIVVKSGSPLVNTIESDWFCLKTKHEGSILFTYGHDENDFNFIFETGMKPVFRVHGGWRDYQPQSERTVFTDQPSNIVQLSGKSFYTEKVVIGNTYGVPKWVVDKINEIMLCSEMLVDGKQWVAVSGARLEPVRIDRYHKAGWSIELRPAKKRTGNRFVNDAPAAAEEYYVTYNIEGNLFGDKTGPASSNVIQIQNNE